MAMRIFFIYF